MMFKLGQTQGKYEVHKVPEYWHMNSWGVYDCSNCAGRVQRLSYLMVDESGHQTTTFQSSACHCTTTKIDVYKEHRSAEKIGRQIEKGSLKEEIERSSS